MKKTKTKTPRKIKKPVQKNTLILLWTALLFLLAIPILLFVQNSQDTRQHAQTQQIAAACAPSGGTCRPSGLCQSGETDLGQADCSSDGTLTCCQAKKFGCLGSCPNPTNPPPPSIPTDTPIFNGFPTVGTQPNNPTATPQPTATPAPTTSTPQTPAPTQPLPSGATNPQPSNMTNPSSIPSSIPSISPSGTPTNPGGDNSSFLDIILKLIQAFLALIIGLFTGIGHFGRHFF